MIVLMQQKRQEHTHEHQLMHFVTDENNHPFIIKVETIGALV